MKKLLLVVGLMFASVCAFANIELDANLYGNIAKSISYKLFDDIPNNEGTITSPFAFGSEVDASFYFGHRESKFDAGLAIFSNVDVFGNVEHKVSSDKLSMTGSGYNWGFGIGPAFRITFANPFSLYIRPALGFNIFYFEEKDDPKRKIFDLNIFNFSVNVGGRSWLLNVDGFHLGIDYGMIFDLGAGLGSFAQGSESGKSFGSGEADFKIYVGACLNFGDRGFDRM